MRRRSRKHAFPFLVRSPDHPLTQIARPRDFSVFSVPPWWVLFGRHFIQHRACRVLINSSVKHRFIQIPDVLIDDLLINAYPVDAHCIRDLTLRTLAHTGNKIMLFDSPP